MLLHLLKKQFKLWIILFLWVSIFSKESFKLPIVVIFKSDKRGTKVLRKSIENLFKIKLHLLKMKDWKNVKIVKSSLPVTFPNKLELAFYPYPQRMNVTYTALLRSTSTTPHMKLELTRAGHKSRSLSSVTYYSWTLIIINY